MFEELLAKGGLSLDRLYNFCRVARVESFTQAADSDPNRQTLYSRQVKELEAFFGTQLFRRRGRTVLLTEKGRELYALLGEYFSAFEDFTERCGSEMATYVIGAGDSLIQWRMLPRLKQIERALGGADLVLKNMRSRDIVEQVERGDVDFGIVRRDAITSKLDSVGLGSLGFTLFFPAARRSSKLDAEWVGSLEFVGMEGDGAYQEYLNSLASSIGILMRFRVRCSSFPMMATAIKSLGLAAFLPAVASEVFEPNVFGSTRVAGIEKLDRDLVLCWNQRLARLDIGVKRRGEALAEVLRLEE